MSANFALNDLNICLCREYTKQLVALREEKYERKIELLQNTIKKRKRQNSNSDDNISVRCYMTMIVVIIDGK